MENKIAKFTGSAETDLALERMVQSTNEGFSGGRVTKHDLVSWVILYFENHSFQDCLEKIRQDHFDQVAYLESVLKQAKQARKAGNAIPDISAMLAPLSGTQRTGVSRKGKKLEQTELLSD